MVSPLADRAIVDTLRRQKTRRKTNKRKRIDALSSGRHRGKQGVCGILSLVVGSQLVTFSITSQTRIRLPV